jgi:hypothetical protein
MGRAPQACLHIGTPHKPFVLTRLARSAAIVWMQTWLLLAMLFFFCGGLIRAHGVKAAISIFSFVQAMCVHEGSIILIVIRSSAAPESPHEAPCGIPLRVIARKRNVVHSDCTDKHETLAAKAQQEPGCCARFRKQKHKTKNKTDQAAVLQHGTWRLVVNLYTNRLGACISYCREFLQVSFKAFDNMCSLLH